MKYSVKTLAHEYEKWLLDKDFDVKKLPSQNFTPSTYNEYEYLRLIKHFDKLYSLIDSIELTEQFIKGE